MQITLIGKENIRFFQGMIPKESKKEKLLQPVVHRLGAICDGVACGIIIVGIDEGMAQLKWLYVSPDYRNRGIGKALVKAMMEDLIDLDITRVVSVYESNLYGGYMDKILYENDYIISAVKSENYRTTYGQMVKVPLFKKALDSKPNPNYEFVTLGEVPANMIRNSEIMKWFLVDYYKEQSVVCIDSKKKIKGIFMVKRKNEKHYEISFVHCKGANTPVIMTGMIGRFAKNVRAEVKNKNLSADTVLTFQTQGKDRGSFVQHVFDIPPEEIVWFHEATFDSRILDVLK